MNLLQIQGFLQFRQSEGNSIQIYCCDKNANPPILPIFLGEESINVNVTKKLFELKIFEQGTLINI